MGGTTFYTNAFYPPLKIVHIVVSCPSQLSDDDKTMRKICKISRSKCEPIVKVGCGGFITAEWKVTIKIGSVVDCDVWQGQI